MFLYSAICVNKNNKILMMQGFATQNEAKEYIDDQHKNAKEYLEKNGITCTEEIGSEFMDDYSHKIVADYYRNENGMVSNEGGIPTHFERTWYVKMFEARLHLDL